MHFKTGQTGRLDLKDPLSAHWANMINEQAQINQPVYVELDDETNVITNLLIPHTYTVARLEMDERGSLLVHLRESAAIHAVLQSAPNFAAMRDSLRTALDDGSERLITETMDDIKIVDVQTPPDNPGESTERSSPPGPDPPVAPQQSTEWFNQMWNENCVACNPNSECITFQVPDDGCWIRAHIMCHLMNAGSSDDDPMTMKVWIRVGNHPARLNPFVPNHPDCHLPNGWGWHVAPTLEVHTS